MTKVSKIISLTALTALLAIGLIIGCGGDDSTGPSGCYTLTLAGNGNGSVGVQPGADCYAEGTSITVSAQPDAQWQFGSWSGDLTSTDNPATFAMANHNMSITANFIPEQFILTVGVTPAGSGTVTKIPDQQSYAAGDTVRLVPSPAVGYSFEIWSGDYSCDCDTLIVVMDGNQTVTANFYYTRVTISGIVNWPGHTLSNYTYAFADTVSGNLLYLIGQADVNSSTGAYKIALSEIWDPISLVVEAQDDVNNSGAWDPIDAGDGWGYYDGNSNGQWDDYLTVYPGDSLTGIDITLALVGRLLENRPQPVIETNQR